MKKPLLVLFFAVTATYSSAQSDSVNNAPLSKDAPADKSHPIKGNDMSKQYEDMIAPYVRQALKTLPEAKKKFRNGLPKGEAFFLVTRIYDKDGKFEQVFARVKQWSDDSIQGNIANDLHTVKEYHNGQLITFREKDIVDWLISKPDGSEEGNYVGKFLDTIQR
jgi:hypothetical protein